MHGAVIFVTSSSHRYQPVFDSGTVLPRGKRRTVVHISLSGTKQQMLETSTTAS